MAKPIAERVTCGPSTVHGCSLLRTLLNLSPLAMAVKDGQLVYRIANTAFADLFGLRQEEVVGRSDADLLPADFAASSEEWDQIVLTQEVPLAFAEQWPTARGERLFEVSRHPLPAEGDAGPKIAVVLNDITEKRATRGQRDRYVQAVEQSPASVVKAVTSENPSG